MGRHLVLAVLVLAALVAAASAAEKAHRRAGRVTLNPTPVEIGQSSGRVELMFQNTGATNNDMLCGYNSGTLSETPGPDAGYRYVPGGGTTRCTYPDKPFFCMSTNGTEISFDEARLGTPTNTPLPTPTPTS
jgi:hypothetical protein